MENHYIVLCFTVNSFEHILNILDLGFQGRAASQGSGQGGWVHLCPPLLHSTARHLRQQSLLRKHRFRMRGALQTLRNIWPCSQACVRALPRTHWETTGLHCVFAGNSLDRILNILDICVQGFAVSQGCVWLLLCVRPALALVGSGCVLCWLAVQIECVCVLVVVVCGVVAVLVL